MKITCSSQSQVLQLAHGMRASTTNLVQLLVVVHTNSMISAFIMHQQMLLPSNHRVRTCCAE